MYKKLLLVTIIATSLALSACDSSSEKTDQEQNESAHSSNPDILPYLNIKQQSANFALPFCENKNCIDIDIQTIQTQDTWLNSWIEKNQATAIQDQIGLNQNMNLQQAINAYVKKSDAWQAEEKTNKAYELTVYTRMAYQRNQYLLLQIGLDSKQDGVNTTERYYFFAADRKQQKALKILDFEKAYTYMSPGYRSIKGLDRFKLENAGAVNLLDFQVKSAECVEDTCHVLVSSNYKITMVGSGFSVKKPLVIDRVSKETWIRTEGKWWFVKSE